MNPIKVDVLGMELDEWKIDSCTARFGVGEKWATLYDIESAIQGKGHATNLLLEAKSYYEKQGKKFGGSVALNPGMRRIYQKLKIREYK
jgi:hypothetical protein